MSRRTDAIAMAIMVALMLPFTLSTLVLPWGRDQGIYAQAAWQVLDGHMPYSGVFVFKPPGTVLFHVLSQLLFGPHMVAVRALDVGWTLLTGLTLYGLTRKATGNAAASILAGVFFAWRYTQCSYWTHSQTDAFANLPYGLALLLVLAQFRGPGRWLAPAAAGVAVGAAFWFKYTTGGLLPFVVLVPLLRDGREGWRAALAVCIGFVASVLAVVGALWLGGALREFLTIQLDIVLPYTGAIDQAAGIHRRPAWAFVRSIGRFGSGTVILWGLGAVAVISSLARRRGRPWRDGLDSATLAQLGALVWTLSGLLSGFVQGKFWLYQMLTALGGGASLAAIGVWWINRWVSDRWLVAIVMVSLLWTFRPLTYRWHMIAGSLAGEHAIEQNYDSRRYVNTGHSVAQNRAAAAWLSEHLPPGDKVYVWSYDPMIYVLADRRPATRFPYHYPQVVAWAPAHYRTELMDALRADPPAAIVVGTKDSVSVVGVVGGSDQLLADWDELQAFVNDGYELEGSVGRFGMWLRRPDGAPAP